MEIFLSPLFSFPSLLWEIFLENPIAQFIGFIAFGMSMLTFLSGNDKAFMKRMTMSSALWALHFLAMGLLSAGLLNAVDVIKNILAIKYPKNKIIPVVMVIIYLLIGYVLFTVSWNMNLWGYEWKNTAGKLTDWLPIIGSIASTIILFTLRGVWMRVAFLCVLLSWLTYNVLGNSMGGVLSDVILFFTGIWGIWKAVKEDK